MEIWLDRKLSFAQRALALVAAMTPAEKLSQLSFDAPAIPRLGVRAWTWWNEASHGVVPVFSAFKEASSFPVCLALANTWDRGLTREVAAAISDEMRAIHNLTGKELDYWCPTVNMGRDPRWGRNDEAFGEDPLLAGQLASAYVQGIQGEDPAYLKAISTPKHFAANNTEYNRNSASSNMDEATLREYYLPVFEACFREGQAQSVMTAYNRISGVPCSVNTHLLQDILRDEWGFDGYVVSDDGAVGDIGPNYNLMWGQPRGHFYTETMAEGCALALESGTDICCGNDYKVWLGQAVEEGLTDLHAVDRALVRAFTARFRLGEFDPAELLPWHSFGEAEVCSEAHTQTARRAAEASLVLLRNEGELLPLRAGAGKRLLVVGPNAIYRQLGSYSIGGYADTRVSVPPLQGIRELGEVLGFHVSYCKGWSIQENPVENGGDYPVLERAAAENGRTLEEYLDYRTPQPVKALNAALAAERARRGTLPPPVPRHPVDDPDLGKTDEQLWAEALEAARQADVVLVVAGTDPGVTSEGRDRATLKLPYGQDEKLCQLWQVNPHTAAVLVTAGPVTGKFLTQVPAVLWAAYGGESQGTAIAEVVFGQISPSGRSSETWYPDDTCLPPMTDYGVKPLDTPDQLGRTYQYWLGTPLFPFGHGLSYTRFAYSDFHLTRGKYSPNDTLEATVTVENVGDMAAGEVVQLYTKQHTVWKDMPYRQLAAFEKVFLRPGERRTITLALPLSRLRRWQKAKGCYAVPEGKWRFWLGRSAGAHAVLAEAEAEIAGRWDAPLSAVTLRCDRRILKVGESALLRCTAALEDAVRLDCSDGALLTVSDPEVLELRESMLQAKQPGLCTVTLRLTRDGITRESSLPFLVEV